jgi:hypothetical protein
LVKNGAFTFNFNFIGFFTGFNLVFNDFDLGDLEGAETGPSASEDSAAEDDVVSVGALDDGINGNWNWSISSSSGGCIDGV